MGYQNMTSGIIVPGINAKIANNLDFSASISGNTGFVDKSFTKASSSITDGSYGKYCFW